MLALIFLQEQFKQIYIISHVETIKEFFPNILEVSLETDGSSTKWLQHPLSIKAIFDYENIKKAKL